MKQEIIFLTPITFSIVLAVILIAFNNYRLKKRILDAGPLNEISLKILKTISDVRSDGLKWGLVLFFGGAGLFITQYLPYSYHTSPVPYGVEAVCIGLGLLIYYIIMQKNERK